MRDDLVAGIYDTLVTGGLRERLESLPAEVEASFVSPDPGEAHEYFARHSSAVLRELLRLIESEGDEKLKIQARACNAALEAATENEAKHWLVDEDVRLLTEIRRRGAKDSRLPRPVIPLGTSALLVNDDQLLSVASVVKREIASSDSVDLICAFVNFTGVRILEAEIRELCERSGMRLITTTYMGATQRRALDALASWGVQIKIAYERPPANTKLHAKAWMFRRFSGHDTAMIGSSNLSHSALMDGLEWNVRLSRGETPHILDRFASTFERYWGDASFESYDPARDGDRVEKALRVCGGQALSPTEDFFLDVTPRPHQIDILEALQADRARGHYRNLIVAATGTGKTVVAALDYKRLCGDGGQPSLLFVAHRAEILRQSVNVFRTVLRDGSFGELWVAGDRPIDGSNVFASIQSLHEESLERIDPRRYDIVIVDEFHHAEAPTYRRLLNHLSPHILVGLTATPERTDGKNVMEFFDNRVTYEMRLWDALEDQLLCPFQYFGIADTLDLSGLRWNRGRYSPEELEKAYLGQGRDGAALVLRWVEKIVTDWRAMRALGFCVSIRHAEFMAEQFQRFGVTCAALTSNSSEEERRTAMRRLRSRELNVLFTVDLFNEGVDIPEADTLLFLRPTESATVFLQQLGRGLRLAEGKPCATVLDFVGQQHRSFRFDRRFRAMTGLSRTALEKQIAEGFTSLPSGCHIQLDRVTKERVLENVRSSLPTRTQELVSEYRSLSGGRPDYALAMFVRETGIELGDLYRRDRTYSTLKRMAGVLLNPAASVEAAYSKGLHRLLHIDDEGRLLRLAERLRNPSLPRLDSMDVRSQRELYMLAYTLTSDLTLGELEGTLQEIWQHDPLRTELTELLTELSHLAPPGPVPLGIPRLEHIPILSHGTYSQDEVMTAFGWKNPSSMRQGVHYFQEDRCDVFFVTLRKTETEYSPTTRYNDYPISPDLFHWESQNSTSADSPVGRRYTRQQSLDSTILLFVREARNHDGRTAPYFCCGPVDYVEHESEKPMKVIWKLRTPLPHKQFLSFRAVSG